MSTGNLTSSTVSGGMTRYYTSPLNPLFLPQTIAVIGATDRPNSIGRMVLWNIVNQPFGGTVYPVNPNRKSTMGIKAYPDIKSVPEPVDLAVIVTPAATVPGIVQQCADAKVRGVVIISAGFREVGPEGAALEDEIFKIARESGMRVIGPNCLGIMSPLTGLNASFAKNNALPGHVGFVSQSGALCSSILDWSIQEKVGFSYFISIGSMLDVSWGDIIDYLGDDPRTSSIVIYMESIGDARAFLSAAREVAMTKPIVVIKAGKSSSGAKAAASHTGALTGDDEVLDAAFKRCGILRVNRIEELFSMAHILAKQPLPRGPRLALLTNAGGPGVLATDTVVESGAELAALSDATLTALNELLPAHWSHGNPVDVLGDAKSYLYGEALKALLADPNCDGVLVILTPQAVTEPTATAEAVQRVCKDAKKPILACWMGGGEVVGGISILNNAGIPAFPYPDVAVQAFGYMWQYSHHLKALYETPSFTGGRDEVEACRSVQNAIDAHRQAVRFTLTELESKELLAQYGIPCIETRLAKTKDEAVALAGELGYPLVMKLNSHTLTHKSDVGGVELNLADADEIKKAWQRIRNAVGEQAGAHHFEGVTLQPMIRGPGYEVIVGSSPDPQFGPVLLFGMGGRWVEVVGDRSVGLPPLTTTLARHLMEPTRVYRLLKEGGRGQKPANLDALQAMLVHFSQLLLEQKWIREIDINPLWVTAEGVLAMDARILLYDSDVTEDAIPKPAIRPYPIQYDSPWTLRDGRRVRIRPIRPDDETLIVKLHEDLSEQSVYYYFFHPVKFAQRTSHDRLQRICFLDYDRQITLIAEHKDTTTGDRKILGAIRLIKQHGKNEAEFAMILAEPAQGQGLGTEMLNRIIAVAKDEQLDVLTADILPDNHRMKRLCEKFNFQMKRTPDDPVVQARLNLR